MLRRLPPVRLRTAAVQAPFNCMTGVGCHRRRTRGRTASSGRRAAAPVGSRRPPEPRPVNGCPVTHDRWADTHRRRPAASRPHRLRPSVWLGHGRSRHHTADRREPGDPRLRRHVHPRPVRLHGSLDLIPAPIGLNVTLCAPTAPELYGRTPVGRRRVLRGRGDQRHPGSQHRPQRPLRATARRPSSWSSQHVYASPPTAPGRPRRPPPRRSPARRARSARAAGMRRR